jgi:SWIM zinc finger
MSESGTVAYRYAMPSALSGEGVLSLATSGGATEAGRPAHPYFFTGFLCEPGPTAQALLACAAIARARYGVPSGSLAALADPVVTCNVDRLRFESFSGCCGVHARLDLPPDALEAAPVASGTTNVDFNPPMRAALTGAVATAGQLLLKVGDQEVVAVTESASVTERTVKLPARWVKGFGEVSALHAAMRLVADIPGPEARRFLAALPRAARDPLWVVPAGRTLSLAASPRPGAACLTGPERLGELRPLLRFTERLRVYAAAGSANLSGQNALPAPSAWELTLGTARFILTLSPEKYRGFTGEGALLDALATETAGQDADLIGLLLGWDPVISLPGLSSCAGLPPERTEAALAALASGGRVGYDLMDGAYFHRELPFGAEVAQVHPRLAGARSLAETGQVTLSADGAMSGGHRVRFGPRGMPGDTCTCPWWGKHQGTRGPCKHVLAARIVRGAR